ncbi:MAG: hypothetical protein EBU83_03190 [bacterium]|nr:hypothetical protein [Chloroflexota bacterium]NBO52429.1 hypothetical protein [Candidatus Aquidulcis sp.]
MADQELVPVPPLRRPLLMVAVTVNVAAIGVGLSGTDERLFYIPAAVGLLWLIAYRAQPHEGVRNPRRVPQGSITVRRPDRPAPRQRTEMPPTPSGFAPSAAVAAAQARGGLRKPIRRVEVGLPTTTPTPKKKPRRGRKGGDGPNLGL